MAIGIEEVILNINNQDKRFFVLTEDGLEMTDMGHFEDYGDAAHEAEYLDHINQQLQQS